MSAPRSLARKGASPWSAALPRGAGVSRSERAAVSDNATSAILWLFRRSMIFLFSSGVYGGREVGGRAVGRRRRGVHPGGLLDENVHEDPPLKAFDPAPRRGRRRARVYGKALK